VIVARFNVGNEGDWRLGDLYYYDANDFAVFAVTAMPIGLYFLQARQGGLRRWIGTFGLLVLTLAFVRSGSRGGFLAAVAVMGFILLRYTEIPFRWRLSATLLIALVFFGTASDRYWHEMGTIFSEEDYNRTEESGRLEVWRRGIGYLRGSPILGVGPDNFSTAEGTLSPFADRQAVGVGVRWGAAHNSYLQIAVELGFPGLIMFLGFIVTAFRALRWCGRADQVREAPQLAPALMASLIGFVVGAFFLSLAYTEMLYTLVALAVGLQKVTSRALAMERTA
jgi:putative inorganic carbon (HCO3(-)) transporter